MEVVESSKIWNRTLAPQIGDENNRTVSRARELLRGSFTTFRERAAVLAAEIPRNLRQLTVHDITHIDALWGIADLIVGEEYPFTPAEAYVLGGAFLLHDLGLALSAYPNGIKELKLASEWSDTYTATRRRLERQEAQDTYGDEFELKVEQQTVETLLRQLHAKQAHKLGTLGFSSAKGRTTYFLIDDPDLREAYGPLIGQIAYSHWWPIDRLESALQPSFGAFRKLPQEWTVDPIKIACLLRTADACHLDSGRAPGFLRALRKPTGDSELHWKFQEFLQQPTANNHQLQFTSIKPFSSVDKDAWWLAHDALAVADRELRDVDALLSDTGRRQFIICGIAGANDPNRLRRLIPTVGWEPVSTSLRVSDVASLVKKLGGEATYGNTPYVPLRELIQNARDAILARRLQEGRDSSWGNITVTHHVNKETECIIVEDNGVGMSKELLTGPFLDFGNSYWHSELMMHEHPGLAAKDFSPEGKYGIGFFSAFMWGDKVQVRTRSYNSAKLETYVLEFEGGLRHRPTLRIADTEEQLTDPGTVVSVQLRSPSQTIASLLKAPTYLVMVFPDESQPHKNKQLNWTLKELCEWLCPTLDVDLIVSCQGESSTVVKANDWISLSPDKFFDRLLLHHPGKDKITSSDTWGPFVKCLRPILDHDKKVIGRAILAPFSGVYLGNDKPNENSLPQVFTSGGIRAGQIAPRNIVGVLLGEVNRVSRFWARSHIHEDPSLLADWCSEQVEVTQSLFDQLNTKVQMALFSRSVGGRSGTIPIAIFRGKLLTANAIAKLTELSEVVYLKDYTFDISGFTPPNLGDDEFGVFKGSWKPHTDFKIEHDPLCRAEGAIWSAFWMSLWGAVIEAVALAWNVKLQDVLEASDIQGALETHGSTDDLKSYRLVMRRDTIRKPGA